MDFVAIDFETACASRSSACSLGIIQVEQGKVIDSKQWLIRPYPFYFHWGNIAIHGIKPEDVIDEPEFDELWEEIVGYLSENMVVAHNASFDISVLRSLLDTYNLTYPFFDYLCTKKIAEKKWPDFDKYGLSYVSEKLQVEFQHHDALEDAFACAQIAIKACQETSSSTLYDLSNRLELGVGKLYPGGYRAASIKPN